MLVRLVACIVSAIISASIAEAVPTYMKITPIRSCVNSSAWPESINGIPKDPLGVSQLIRANGIYTWNLYSSKYGYQSSGSKPINTTGTFNEAECFSTGKYLLTYQYCHAVYGDLAPAGSGERVVILNFIGMKPLDADLSSHAGGDFNYVVTLPIPKLHDRDIFIAFGAPKDAGKMQALYPGPRGKYIIEIWASGIQLAVSVLSEDNNGLIPLSHLFRQCLSAVGDLEVRIVGRANMELTAHEYQSWREKKDLPRLNVEFGSSIVVEIVDLTN